MHLASLTKCNKKQSYQWYMNVCKKLKQCLCSIDQSSTALIKNKDTPCHFRSYKRRTWLKRH